MKLNVKLFADGADKNGMLEMYANPLISGFTTNPTLMKNSGIKDYKNFGDWSNLTVKLAEKGFNEKELKKILGLNYLRYFREVIG